MHKARLAFEKQMQTLEQNLISSGLERHQIDEILKRQAFSLEESLTHHLT